ncbi:MAG: flagellar biosynthesis anti-sigma factor FlgM [Sedimentisphaerales bacterium]|nr:flagellar biosynthesis anti-sigma factor FlgM [Sedimentisphaerales bacterium]
MSDLSQQNNVLSVIAENTDVYLDWDSGNKAQGRITASALKKNHSLPPVRKKKILKIRQQLAEGTYDIDDQLNVALDLLLDDLIG